MGHPRAEIERYLAAGLPPEDERTLRAHLRSCAECRQIYDAELRLRRAFAGAPTEPTRAEEQRLHRLVMEQLGLQAAPTTAAPATSPPRPAAFFASAWPRRLAWGAAALALAVVLLVRWHPRDTTPSVAPPSNPQPVLAARLTQAKGVTVGGLAVGVGSAIVSGTAITVAADGLAELDLVRGGRARLFPRTRLQLAPQGEAIVLAEGRLWCEVTPGRGRFLVKTAGGEARVLGTSFVVEQLASQETDVRVLSGVVEVEDAGHRGVVRVRGGQRTRIRRDTAPQPAERYDSGSDRSDWEDALGRIGQKLERGLRKLGDKLRLP